MSTNVEMDTEMYSEKNRLKSFENWPHDTGNITKEMMAKNGFYHHPDHIDNASTVIRVPIVAYVIPNLLHCDLIIGTDMLSRITRIDPLKSLKWKSKFGDIHYGPMVAIEHLKNDVNDIVDEENSDKHVARIDTPSNTGSFGVKYPFLSRVRPQSNPQKHYRGTIDDIRQCVFDANQMLSSGFELRKICFNVSIANGMPGENSMRKISEDSISSKYRDSLSSSVTKRIVLSTIVRIIDFSIFDHLKLRLQIMFSRIVPTGWNSSFKDVYARVLDESFVNWSILNQIKFNRFSPYTFIMYCLAVAIEPGLGYCLGSRFSFEKNKIASQMKTIVGKVFGSLLKLVETLNYIRKILSQSQTGLSIGIFLDLKIILFRSITSSNRFECHFGIRLRRVRQIITDCRIPVIFISGILNLADMFILPILVSKFLHQKPRHFRSINFLNDSYPFNMIRWIISSSLSFLVKNIYHEASNGICHFCFKVLYANLYLKSSPGRLNFVSKSYPLLVTWNIANAYRFDSITKKNL
ncbi:hypothetical protein DERF_002716 [Dermatophagoides farinae]|uniref:Uncharacterized protein n=1 Tax=Dermatophagoides farinae TaxID=6954 RepID=A0A922IE94_DERFA|nr:hypothetical protein DERF_002716 [Dermatophagoides farinae]